MPIQQYSKYLLTRVPARLKFSPRLIEEVTHTRCNSGQAFVSPFKGSQLRLSRSTWSLTHGHDRSVRRERDGRKLHSSWPYTRLTAQPDPAPTSARGASTATATTGQALGSCRGTSGGQPPQLRPPTIPSVVVVPRPRGVYSSYRRCPVEGRRATTTGTN